MKWNKKAQEGPPGYVIILWAAIIFAILIVLLVIMVKFTNVGRIGWDKIKNMINPFS